MNIYYYHAYAGSINNPKCWRPYYLSKALSSQGHNAHVVTASFHHLQREPYGDTQISSNYENRDIEKVKFSWLKTPYYEGNGISRIKQMITFGIQAFRFDPVSDLGGNVPDIIIISSAHPFHFFAGLKWARKYRAKLYFEVRDLWPLSLNLLLGMSKFHPFSLLLSAFQKFAILTSDAVISTLDNAQCYLLKKGLERDRFLFLSNGTDLNQPISNTSIISYELSKIRSEYSKIVMYTGSLGVPNAMDVVVDMFNQLSDYDIALVIIGSGDQLSNLKNMAGKNVFFLGPIVKEEIQLALSYSDVCIISWNDTPLYEYGVSPNKIFDYMLARKPIFQIIPTRKNQVSYANCGINTELLPSYILANKLLEFVNQDSIELEQLGDNGYKYLKENCTYDVIAKRLIDYYNLTDSRNDISNRI